MHLNPRTVFIIQPSARERYQLGSPVATCVGGFFEGAFGTRVVAEESSTSALFDGRQAARVLRDAHLVCGVGGMVVLQPRHPFKNALRKIPSTGGNWREQGSEGER